MLVFEIFQKAYFEQKKQYNLFSSLFSLYHTNHFFTVIYIDIKFTSNGKNIKPYLYFFHVRMCTICEFGCLLAIREINIRYVSSLMDMSH